MIINFDKTKDYLKDIRSGKIREGYKLGFDEIDQYLRFKESNFNVIPKI